MKNVIGWAVGGLLVIGAIIWLNFVITINRQVDIMPGTIFTINEGQSVGQIAGALEEQGLIRSAFFFKVHVKLTGQQGGFQAGDYLLEKDYDTKQLVKILTSGQALSKEKTVLIREGLRTDEIVDYLSENQLVDANDFKQLALTRVDDLPEEFSKYEWLERLPAKANLEGYLFPDTYRIFVDATHQDLMIKMLDNFTNKVTPKMMADIDEQGKTLSEIMTMASLIEKEVRSYEDMHIVSGIFWNRINDYQPLQSCATLAYILGENKPQYTTADTQVQSPYNTYQNYGLPPGPIANPGLQAIKAAIYPEVTDYYYFLSRPDTGETVFSRTYNEHKAAKAKYLD